MDLLGVKARPYKYKVLFGQKKFKLLLLYLCEYKFEENYCGAIKLGDN